MASNQPEEDPLQDSLASAFSQPISLPTAPASPTASISAPAPAQAPAPAAPAQPAVPGTENWQQEYDARVSEWRAQSAVARKKAEETRERYAAIREQEAASGTSTEQQPQRWPLGAGSPSPADARDLVAGESQGHSPPVSVSHPSDAEEKWEDVPSVMSSFPSLPSGTSPPEAQAGASGKEASSTTHHHHHHRHSHKDDEYGGKTSVPSKADLAKPQPPAVTPLVLDVSLPLKTRAFALLSSIAINMFLPFVNGVMLGFGEIFARNVVAPWIGWQTASVLRPNGPRSKPPSPAEVRREDLRRRKAEF